MFADIIPQLSLKHAELGTCRQAWFELCKARCRLQLLELMAKNFNSSEQTAVSEGSAVSKELTDRKKADC